jgi:hypothetical protein
MVVALFALAVAMVIGGLTAVVQGYDIVLLERGWTLVIAGSVCATGGALLAGMAVAVARLGRIRKELVQLREGADRIAALLPTNGAFGAVAGFASAVETPDTPEAHRDEDEAGQPELPPFMRPDRTGRAEEIAPGRDFDRLLEPELEPEREDPRGSRLFRPRSLFGRRQETGAEPAAETAAADLPEPDLGAPGRELTVPEPAMEAERETPGRDIEKSLAARLGLIFGRNRDAEPDPDRENEPVPGPGTLVPTWDASLRPEPDPERDALADRGLAPYSEEDKTEGALPAPLPPEPEAPIEESVPADGPAEEVTVVGTYNSGNNHYVMYSDGSIEAETPEGKFRFESLDELKEFIASGGEGGARSAS